MLAAMRVPGVENVPQELINGYAQFKQNFEHHCRMFFAMENEYHAEWGWLVGSLDSARLRGAHRFPDFLGRVEGLTAGVLRGWVYKPSDPTRTIDVHVYCHGMKIGRCRANECRPELKSLGIGDGAAHGFSFAVPNELREVSSVGDYVICIADTLLRL